MMRYYIDKNFCLHLNDDGNMMLWDDENSIFKGKCQNFIEGFRVIPEGMSWTRPDGKIFSGPMIAPWRNSIELTAAQRGYEEAELIVAELDAALLNSTYQNILDSIE